MSLLLISLSFFGNAFASEINASEALASFLSDNKPKMGLFESDAKIKNISLIDSFGKLVYRIESTRCIADATFKSKTKYVLKSITCGGENPKNDFKDELSKAQDLDQFNGVLREALSDKILTPGKILELATDEIGNRFRAKELESKDALEWMDNNLSFFFVGGHNISGGFVQNGEINSGMKNAILNKESYTCVNKVRGLISRLKE